MSIAILTQHNTGWFMIPGENSVMKFFLTAKTKLTKPFKFCFEFTSKSADNSGDQIVWGLIWLGVKFGRCRVSMKDFCERWFKVFLLNFEWGRSVGSA